MSGGAEVETYLRGLGIPFVRHEHPAVAIDGAIRDAPRVACHPNVNTATLVLSGADFQRYLAAIGHQVRWI